MKKTSFKDGAFFATESLSPRIEKTPEGYLICHDVAISRTGSFPYLGSEAGIDAPQGEQVEMSRTEDELFSTDTIRSFEGKPVVIGHSSFVTPFNWRDRSVGIVQNVRRGASADADKLVADLLITDSRGIDAVESGRLREVSCGYDANAVDDGNGRGHQVGIVGNHVALVERGRCGVACSIRDEEMSKLSLKNILRRAFKDGDEEKFNAELDNLDVKPLGDEAETPAPAEIAPAEDDRIAAIEKQIADIQTVIAKLVEPQEEAAEPVQDEEPEEIAEEPEAAPDEEAEVAPEEEKEEVFADAEDVCEGIKKPVADSAIGGISRGALNRLRRAALKQGGVTQFGDVDSMSNEALAVSLKAAAVIARSKNNPVAKASYGDSAPAHRPSNAELNRIYKDFWSNK